MKRLATFLALLMTIFCSAQVNFLPMPDDFCSNSLSSQSFSITSTTSSTNGWVHTPKGNLHILIIFISDSNNVPDPSYDGDPLNDSIGYWNPDSIPNWTMGTSNQLLDETTATIGANKNLSLFYREMSHGQFILTGDIFPDIIPTANGLQSQAIAYINSNYPSFNWSKYDNRTNHPNYNLDNSASAPDSIIDYVVFIKRRNGFNGNAGVGGSGSHTVTTNHSGSPVIFTISDGHTAETCFNSASHHHIFFKHEFAHNLYKSSHYLCANSSSDGKYYYQYVGWGLMAAWHEQFNVANAWESWWLGWINAQEITTSGIYQIKDYLTHGDAVRIPIPNTNGEYLWIENHQKIDLHGFDDKPFYKPSAGSPLAEDIDPGLYMYVTKHFGNRGDPSLMGLNLDATNFIKLFNAEGNFDLNWDQLPKLPVAGAGPADVFVKSADNPIAGQNTYCKVKYNKDGNGIIYVPYWDGNSARLDESSDVIAEVINGVRTPTYARTGKHNQAFILGSEVGLSGIFPITNYPVYDNGKDKMKPYILNGLSVKVTNYNSGTGEYTLNVNFGDYQVRYNKRWCGNIELPTNPIPNAYSLEVLSGVTLTVDKSGTPNKKNEIFPGSRDFVDTTVLNCLANSKINIQINSNLIVDNNSTLKLSSNSKIDINSGAILRVKRGSKLVLEGNATINVLNGGRIIIENDGSMDYFPNAIIKLNGSNSVLEIDGMLNIKDNATFTFSYPPNASSHGYVKFANTSLTPSRNITAGNNCNINFTGSSQSNKILQIDQETFYAPPSIVNFTISTGKVELASNARIQADGLNTNINLFNAKFTSTTPGVYNGHRGFHLYGQPNVSINSCVFEYGSTGIYANLTPGGSPLTIFSSTFRNNTNGVLVNDKGCNLYNCNFLDNEFGFSGGYMSFPSVCEGCLFSGSTLGCYWISYSNASLTINNSNFIYNNTGIKAQATPLIVTCSNVSYNDTGFYILNGASLTMNNQSKVVAIGNNYTIRPWQANTINLTYGNNDLTPSGLHNQSVINGRVLLSSSIPPPTSNKWNVSGTFNSNDYLILDNNSVNVAINDASPLASALACGVDPCPNPPCGEPCKHPPCEVYAEDALVYCPDCRTINTTDFPNNKLNDAISKAIAKVNSHDSQNYRKGLKLFSQILNVNFPNPNKHESYLLNLNYLKLQETLGNVFLSKQINSSNVIADEVQMIIEIENSFIDKANQQNNYYRKFLYSMDKAQTYRIANKRDLSLNLLNNILGWAHPEDVNEVNKFICTIHSEIDALEGRIDLGTLSDNLKQCNHSDQLRLTSSINNSSLSITGEETMISIFPNPINDIASIRTNIENAHIILFDNVGRSIIDEKIHYESDIDLSSFSRGIYIMKIENINTSEYWFKKLIVQ